MADGETRDEAPMLHLDWSRALEAADLDEVLSMVALASEYDAEAGFARIAEESVKQRDVTSSGRAFHHLVVRGELDDVAWDGEGGQVVGYLNLTVDGDDGVVQLTVHPRYRSRGVATMMLEQIGLDVAQDGWQGSGARFVHAWAFGHHPAAERLARRFGLTELARSWQLLANLTGPFAVDLGSPPEVDDIVLSGSPALVAAVDSRELGAVAGAADLSDLERQQLEQGFDRVSTRITTAVDGSGAMVGFVSFDGELGLAAGLRSGTIDALVLVSPDRARDVGSALLDAVLRSLRGAGAQVALMRIDPRRDAVVRLTRVLGFARDQDDAHYGFGDPRAMDDEAAGRRWTPPVASG
jgi:mycothiol synthase